MSAVPEPAILLKDVHYEVDGRVILEGVSAEITPGEIFGVMGMSGVGKSTLLRLVIGLIRPQAGEIWVLGQPVHALGERELNQVRRRMGLCFQGAALFDSLSVAENVAFGLVRTHRGLSAEEVQRRVEAQLDLVGMEGTEEMRPSQLSGGMRKRVGVARAMIMEPEIMLYDEPTSGLDPIMSAVIVELIAKLRQQFKVTSLVVTHEVDQLLGLADRIMMLYQGRAVTEDTPENIRCCADPIVRQFVAGSPIGPIPV